MPQYKKKSVIIQAEQYDGTPASIAKIRKLGDSRKIVFYPDHLDISTLEGVHRANIGDFIIRGIAGELYPCKPDIFFKTYEEV